MTFSFVPSLMHTSIISTLSLLMKHNLYPLIIRCIDNFNGFTEVQKKLDENMAKLLIPENIKLEISKHSEYMLRKFTSWMKRGITQYPEISSKMFFNLHFTPIGTVNEQKSLYPILENENIDVKVRYYLACAYCIEERINMLWLELMDQDVNTAELLAENRSRLINYWTHKMLISMTGKGRKRARYEARTKEYFEMAVRDGNPSAARYFWNELPLETKRDILRYEDFPQGGRYWPTSYIEFLFSAVPGISNEYRHRCFNTAAFQILDAFLEWPWCIFFVNAAENLFCYLSEKNYYDLLETFLSCDGILYQDIVNKFLQKSPQSYRFRFFNDQEYFRHILFEFLSQNNKETARVLIDILDVSERENFVCSYDFKMHCHCIEEYTIDSVVTFAFECIPSRERQVQWIYDVVQDIGGNGRPNAGNIFLSHI